MARRLSESATVAAASSVSSHTIEEEKCANFTPKRVSQSIVSASFSFLLLAFFAVLAVPLPLRSQECHNTDLLYEHFADSLVYWLHYCGRLLNSAASLEMSESILTLPVADNAICLAFHGQATGKEETRRSSFSITHRFRAIFTLIRPLEYMWQKKNIKQRDKISEQWVFAKKKPENRSEST